MCLHNVKKTFDPNDNIMMGYKVLTNPNKYPFTSPALKGKLDYYNNLIRSDKHDIKKLGQYYKASSVPQKIINFNNEEYDNGFHIYNNLKDARIVCNRSPYYRVIIRVIGWDIRAIGTEQIWDGLSLNFYNYVKVTITKNIRYMEEVK
jgi:hypothetical protein